VPCVDTEIDFPVVTPEVGKNRPAATAVTLLPAPPALPAVVVATAIAAAVLGPGRMPDDADGAGVAADQATEGSTRAGARVPVPPPPLVVSIGDGTDGVAALPEPLC